MPRLENESQFLVEAAQAGDAAANERLITMHLDSIRTFVRLNADPELRRKESCSDLVQSCCRDVLENLDRFDYRGEGSFRAWLFTAVRNRIRDKQRYWRAAKRSPQREEELVDGLMRSYATIYSPSQVALTREVVQAIEDVFDELPESHREVITLSRITGLSHEEVAEQMGRTSKATRNLLSRALVRFTALLEQRGGVGRASRSG